MPYDINRDTPLIPYIIADRAAWGVIEGMPENAKLTGPQIAVIVEPIIPVLVEKAERLYNISHDFRGKLHKRGKDCRVTLETFMQHWTESILKKKQTSHS